MRVNIVLLRVFFPLHPPRPLSFSVSCATREVSERHSDHLETCNPRRTSRELATLSSAHTLRHPKAPSPERQSPASSCSQSTRLRCSLPQLIGSQVTGIELQYDGAESHLPFQDDILEPRSRRLLSLPIALHKMVRRRLAWIEISTRTTNSIMCYVTPGKSTQPEHVFTYIHRKEPVE